MTYRDDHDAALARADAAVREAKVLAVENERLAGELEQARMWLGGPRKRVLLLSAVLALGGLLAVGGFVAGRRSVEATVITVREPAERRPHTFGVIVADGPDIGHWTMNATRCTSGDIGVELTSVGSDDTSVAIIGNDVEIETPHGALTLEKTHCYRRRDTVVTKTDDEPPAWAGFLDLDCEFRGNTVQGRIEFKNCR